MGSLRILLIDDEEELVSTLVDRLGYRGIEAEYALHGVEALEKMSHTEYDVVVLDLKLPGMSGKEVLKAIKLHYPTVPVLMMTGHGAPMQTPDERPEGMFDILAKPIDINRLVTKIHEAAVSG